MNRDDIIRMAREAGFEIDCCSLEWHDRIERFAALVAAAAIKDAPDYKMGYADGVAAERERIIAANAPEIEKINAHFKALEGAVAAEREACAQMVMPLDESLADAIRARGQS